jgi:hypothetical protein
VEGSLAIAKEEADNQQDCLLTTSIALAESAGFYALDATQE